MAIKLMTLAWETDLPQAEKMVMLALADYASDEGVCWPLQEQLSIRCSMSDRNVRRVIESLVEAGLLSKKRQYRSTSYLINIEALKSNRTNCPVSVESNRTQCPVKQSYNRTNHALQPDTVSGSIITVNNRHISPSKKTTAFVVKKSKPPSPHAWFSRWWIFGFHSLTGSRYAYSKKSAGIIKNLLDQIGLEELVERTCVYFTLPDRERFPRGSPTLEGLAAMINQLGGRCTEEIEDRCFAAGLLPDLGKTLADHRPWEQTEQQPAAAAAC